MRRNGPVNETLLSIMKFVVTNKLRCGFLRGMEFNKGKWAALLDDEDNGGLIVPIFALANEQNPDPKLRPYKQPIAAEDRENLIVGAVAGVTGIFRNFEAQRLVENHLFENTTTVRRTSPKIGRIDPCPCGSGKKFKLCCINYRSLSIEDRCQG
jgi:uncharacterized protein